jgi:hypothetical protein
MRPVLQRGGWCTREGALFYIKKFSREHFFYFPRVHAVIAVMAPVCQHCGYSVLIFIRCRAVSLSGMSQSHA